MPAFGGNFNLNSGISTIICCVLISDHSYCRLADNTMFITRLPAIATFVA